jgi:hypothetical protein
MSPPLESRAARSHIVRPHVLMLPVRRSSSDEKMVAVVIGRE